MSAAVRKSWFSSRVFVTLLAGALTGGGWLGVSSFFLYQFQQANAIRFEIDRCRITLLEARRREKDFLLRSLTDPKFYALGTSAYLDLYTQAVADLRDALQALARMVPAERRADMERLDELVEEYDGSFRLLVAALRTRGHRDAGLGGELRQDGQALQQALTGPLQRDFLEIRAREKDYLLRSDAEDARRIRDDLGRLGKAIVESTAHDSAALLAQLDRYQRDLDAYHVLQQKIGVTEDKGLTGKYRAAAHALDPIMAEVFAEGVAAQDTAGRNLALGLLAASLLLTVLLAATFNLAGAVRFRADLLEDANHLLRERTEELAKVHATLEHSHRELEEYAAALGRSNTELQQFAYVASHDLQEPLRAVAGCVQLLQQRLEDQLDERGHELIEHAVSGAGRMQTLIDNLLELSRIETRGQPLVPTDMLAVLTTVRANLEVALSENGAVLTADPLPTVVGDPTQLAQVLQNLIGNAVKFRGSQSPTVHVGAQRDNGAWRFSVRDNGIGIDPQYHERIFRIFQRLHTRRAYPGTGIGLSICKKIVERHGGRVGLESQPHQGSTFFFTIPDRSPS